MASSSWRSTTISSAAAPDASDPAAASSSTSSSPQSPPYRRLDELLHLSRSPSPTTATATAPPRSSGRFSSSSSSTTTATTLPTVRRRSTLGVLLNRLSGGSSATTTEAPATSSASSPPAWSQDMFQVSQAIALRRQQLVNALMPLEGDWVVKVRFVSAVDEYSAGPAAAAAPTPTASSSARLSKDRLGKNICALFGQEGSMFRLQSLAEDTAREMARGRHDPALETAKLEILSQLAADARVLAIVRQCIEGL